MMSEVTPNFAAYISLFMKRKGLFFATALAIMTLGIIYTYVIPMKYEANSTVFIEKNVINELVKGIAISPSMDDSIRVLTTALSSRTLVLKVIGDVDFNLKTKSDAEIEELVTEIQKNTEIKVADKNIFRVKFRFHDPRIARDYVNSLVRNYIEEQVASKRTESYDATNFLTQQIESFKEKVAQTESDVNRFKNEKSASVILDAGQLFREISLAQQKLFDLQLRRKQLQEEKIYVKSATDPVRQKLKVLQRRLEELQTQYTDIYPEIITVKSQIESLKKEAGIPAEPGSPASDSPPEIWKIDAELNAIKENELSIQQHMSENRKLLSSIPASKNSLEKLEAAKATEKTMHDLLSLRSNQAELSKQMEIQDKSVSYRIVDPAVTPVTPVSPNRKKLLLMSMAAGLAGAAGLLLLLDRLDDSVKLVDSLKPLGFPILAVIPFIKSEDEIRVYKERSFKVYVASGVYFSLILTVFLMEILGISIMQKLFLKLHLPQLFSGFFKG